MGRSWMLSWVNNFNKRYPVPVPARDPCAPCRCNTVSVANCRCEMENQLQKAFNQHSSFTVLTLNAILANSAVSANANYMAASLGGTATVISDCISNITHKSEVAINTALTNHINLAADFVGALKNNSGDLQNKEGTFRAQSAELASAFSALNSCMLTNASMLDMWDNHIGDVITIAKLLNNGSKVPSGNNQYYIDANTESASYANDTAEMAIMIADGLAEIYCCQGC